LRALPAYGPASPRFRDATHETSVGIALLRVLILITTVVLTILVALPAVLAPAADPFR